MTIISLLLLFICSTISAQVQPINGENLWRLVSRIGFTVDSIESDVDEVLSDLDFLESDIEVIDANLISIADFLASQADTIDNDLLSIGDALSSQLSNIDQVIVSIGDVLESKLDFITSEFSVIESAIEGIDVDLESALETILDSISQFEALVVSDLAELEECLVGFPVTQADFAAGTFHITVPGVYRFCEDITMTSANPAISVDVSDVQIDLNGHTFTVDAIGINISGQSTMKINNGHIVTSPAGLAINILSGASNIIIEDISGSNGGISVDNSQGITISRYNGIGNGSTVRIVNNSSGIVVQDSSVTSTAALGFPFSGFFASNNVVDVVFDRCIASSALVGFLITSNNNKVLLRNCYASDTNAGFESTATTGGTIYEQCIAEFSTDGFLVDVNVIGDVFVECVASNNDVGFELRGSSLLLKRCVANNNTVGIDITAAASNVQILDSCTKNNTTDITNLGTNTTFINLETVENAILSELEEIAQCACSGIDHITSALDAISAQISSLDTVGSGIDVLDTCLIGTSITNADLPFTASAAGIYTVCEPLVFNGSPVIPVITIGADNVVVNLNGQSITTNNQAVVCSAHTNVTIYNGTIQSGLESIVINNSQSIMIHDLVIYQPADVGIRVNSGTGVTIMHCTCEGFNGTASGATNPATIYLSNCGSTLVKNCVVAGITAGTPVRGIAIIETALGGVELQQCSVYTVTNEAFRIASASNNLDNVIVKNCVASECGDGFLIIHTSASGFGPIIDHCISENNGARGFVISLTQGSTLNNCIAARNVGNGFLFDSGSNQTASMLCISQDNATGFEIDGTQTTLRWCTACNSANNGFNISGSAISTVIDDCLASNNGGSGLFNNGTTTTILDSRSQHVPTSVNLAYNLNAAPDVNGLGVIIITS